MTKGVSQMVFEASLSLFIHSVPLSFNIIRITPINY
jgi:hypothetical protein